MRGACGLAFVGVLNTATSAAASPALVETPRDGFLHGLAAWAASPVALAPQTLFLAGAAGLAVLGIAGGLLGFFALRRARLLGRRNEFDVADLDARLNAAESILAAEPDAVFIWSPESLHANADAPQARPRIVGSTAIIVDPASGELDFTYLLTRLEPENAERLTDCVQHLRLSGTRFSLHIQSLDGRTFEAEGRPAGALAVLWLRDVTGERAEVSRLSERLRRMEASSARFEEHLMSAPFPAWRRNADGRLAWANEAYARAVDATSPEDAVVRGLELLSEDVSASLRRRLSERPRASERTHAIMAGERRAIEVFEQTIKGGFAGIAIDVSTLDATEGELRRHIASHAATLDRVKSAVAICGPDKRLKFRNRAFELLWGLDPQWLDTEPTDGEILDQLRARRRLPEQANFQLWKQGRMELYTSPEPVEEYWHLPDARIIKVVGQAHPFGGVVYLYENVTEQLNLASSYNTLTRVQRETIDHLYEGVAVFGSDGRLKLSNPAYARIWALGPEALEGEPHVNDIAEATRILYSEESQVIAFKTRITQDSGARASSTGRLNRTDGSMVDYAIVPLPDGASLITYIDVTASIKMELALRERNDALETADRLKSEFISHVSYQLRTPLTNIIGFGQILEAEMFGNLNPKQHEYTKGILNSSDTLLDIVNDILDLAVIEAGAMTLDLSEVAIADVVAAAEHFARLPAQKNRVVLKVECQGDLGTVWADEKRIKQIMINLLSNAVAYTGSGDMITIGATRLAHTVQFFVADTGIGIKPEFQATVFDRFESHASQDHRRGAGLGLSLVRSFMELHGGWVSLESKPDIGTRVTCHLPIHAVAATVDTAPISPIVMVGKDTQR